MNSQLDAAADEQFYEPEISYLEDAYSDEKQAYGVAIQQQIAELDEQIPENVSHNGRKVAAQSSISLKERLKRIHKEVEVAARTHEEQENTPVVKYEVLEFPLAERVPFQESQFLKELDNQSGSEGEDEDEEEGDEEEVDEEEVDEDGDEGEEGVEEGEEEDDEEDEEPAPAAGPDHIIELDDDDEDDEGEEVDDDEDDDDDAAPHTKKQRT